MKKTRNTKIALIALTLLLALSAMFGVRNAQRAEAQSLDDYSYDEPTVYYFFDYCPSVLRETFAEQFGDSQQVVYDHFGGTSTQLLLLVNSNYFSALGDQCIVVIDLKGIDPPIFTLNTLFATLKNQGCKTIFITLKPQTYYGNAAFFNNLDYFYTSDYSIVEDFAEKSVEDMVSQDFQFENSVYFIERSLYNVDLYVNSTLAQKLANPFLGIFIEHLKTAICNIEGLAPGSIPSSADQFCSQYNIALIGYSDNVGKFVDIISGTIIDCALYFNTFVQGIDDLDLIESDYDVGYAAFGIWQFWDDDFYDLLRDGQDSGEDILVYVIEADEIVPAEDGLQIVGAYSGSEGDASEEVEASAIISNELENL